MTRTEGQGLAEYAALIFVVVSVVLVLRAFPGIVGWLYEVFDHAQRMLS